MTHLSTLVEIAAHGGHLAEMAIASLTAELRRIAGQHEPPYHTHEILGASFPDLLVTGSVLPPGVYAVLSRTSDGPVILYARGQPAPLHRHAIMHELAHFLFDGVEGERRPGEPSNHRIEARCDDFADEGIAPLADIRKWVKFWPSDQANHGSYLDSVDRIASRFNVMADVVDRRIRLLEWMAIRSGELKFRRDRAR